jgi:hypothetical protein
MTELKEHSEFAIEYFEDNRWIEVDGTTPDARPKHSRKCTASTAAVCRSARSIVSNTRAM